MQWQKALAIVVAAVLLTLQAPSRADAQARRANTGAAQLVSAAERGDPRAQVRVAFMYETGRGLPQDYYQAASWYHRAAESGYPPAQHRLGLMFDKGQGVPEDYVEAYKWLNIAAAAAGPAQREYYLRVRDAVARKMTQIQLSQAQWLSSHWRPRP
jgi:TPR repeat protein